MNFSIRALFAFSWLLALTLPRSASATDRLLYELSAGSTILDECGPCDRAPILRSLKGSFVLFTKDLSISGASYELEGIEFQDESGDYQVTGSGSYARAGGKTQEMSLDLQVSGAKGVGLKSGAVEIVAAWPALEIKITEAGERDPFHIYTIHLLAEPPAKEVVQYGLGKGSSFIDECLICGRPPIITPLSGTFFLGKVEERPDYYTTYRVAGIDFRDAGGASDLEITGGGCYAQGGDFALMQDMSLELVVNGAGGALLVNAGSPPGARFPEIDVGLLHQNPESSLHVYTLHLVAAPVEVTARSFRRGDANDDGGVDISDPITVLLWRFAGGAEPGCLEAAEANDDGRHDVSDAVFLLDYLFLEGPIPPAPGPDACGPGGQGTDCRSYESCAATS